MRERRDNTAGIFIILMVIVTIIALTFVGILGALYIRQRDISEELRVENEKLQAQVSVPVFSLEDPYNEIKEDVTTENIKNDETGVDASAYEGDGGKENTIERDSQNEIKTESAVETENNISTSNDEDGVMESLKQRMKDIVTAEDGSPLKMLREFFPENLIYYDEKEYYFAPVLDEVNKHHLIDENFRKNDRNEMEYVVNGEVVSHKGIDVSKYQGEIDWEKVKEDNVEYAFVRLGIRGYESGKIVVDDYFDQNMQGAADAGIRTGVYFFTQAINKEEALEEANFVIESIKNYDITCPVVFDVETVSSSKGRANNLTQQERTDITIAFCEAIKNAGYIPMVYGNVKCFTKMLDMTRLNAYEKWYAFYDDYMYMPYEVTCWQYTEKGNVKGISEKVDVNISYKMW